MILVDNLDCVRVKTSYWLVTTDARRVSNEDVDDDNIRLVGYDEPSMIHDNELNSASVTLSSGGCIVVNVILSLTVPN